MCCSNGHYPPEVGLYLWGNQEAHYHIRLPWSDRIGICCYWYSYSGVIVQWTQFMTGTSNDYRNANVTINLSSEEDAKELSELIAIGVAEGGRISTRWVRDLVSEWGKPVNFLGESGFSQDWKVEPPEVLEYHEWLVIQASREVEDKRAKYQL